MSESSSFESVNRKYGITQFSDQEADSLLSYSVSPEDTMDKTDIGDKMWTWNFIGLYAQYAAVGLIGGMAGLRMNFCVYVYGGRSNLCSNVSSIVSLPWSFKIFYAIFTDSYRPFGMRRKPYIITGWICVLLILLIMAFTAESLSVSSWVGMNVLMQTFVLLADVPADGYSVELSQLQSPDRRGQILATGQIVRFSFGIIASAIQTFFVNGPTTNNPDCNISWSECWSYGLTMNQYYLLMFTIIFSLFIPIFALQELDGSHIPRRNLREFMAEIWDTLQSLTAFNLLIYVLGGVFALGNPTLTFMCYYVIKLTSFQSGIDMITSGLAGVLGLTVFTNFWINRNWRYVNYFSSLLCCLLGCLWLFVFYDVGGLMNAWFAIFIDLDQSFIAGLSQVLFSMAVIELAKPGQEATTYQLLISVANASSVFSNILSTQLLSTTSAIGCTSDDCPRNTVDIRNKHTYFHSNGPRRFTDYTMLAVMTNIVSTIVFTQYLPRNKEQCHDWNDQGSKSRLKNYRGMASLLISVVIVLYGVVAAFLLLNKHFSCSTALDIVS